MGFRFVLCRDKAPIDQAVERRSGQGERECGEGFHYPDRHPQGQGRTLEEESLALPGQRVAEKDNLERGTQLISVVPPEQGGDRRPKRGEEETSPSMQAQAFSKN